MPDQLRLRPLRLDDEAAFRAGHAAMAPDHFPFGLEGFTLETPWAPYVAHLAAIARGDDLQEGRVPADFLVANVGGEIVGRVSIRHHLTDWLLHQGGHIGYGVLPAHRRRGYATEILRQALIVARSRGVERALLTCDDDNAGSATVIERAGGVLEDVRTADDGTPVRRYWID